MAHRFGIAALVLGSACVSTTTSRPGSFLTNVSVVPTGLSYTTCDVEYDVTRSWDPFSGSSKGVKATTAGCGVELVKFPEDSLEVPAHCWAAIEPWLGTPASKEAERRARWDEIPVDCQALLAGGRT
jgi:hypothetical protein